MSQCPAHCRTTLRLHQDGQHTRAAFALLLAITITTAGNTGERWFCVRNGCGGLTFVPHADQWSAERLVPSSWSELFERIWGEKIGKKNSASTLMVWLHSLFLQRHQTQIKEKVGNKTAGITAKKDFYINAHSSVPCHLTPISVSKSSIYKSILY